MSENSLLQVISEYVGGMYISDISARWFSPEAKENIRRIPDETFTLKEWHSAVTYILRVPCAAETVAQAKVQLLRKK